MGEMTYKEWVEAEADFIRSDGCTLVSELYHWACLEHDLAYTYGRDPKDAYNVGWGNAKAITRGEADKRFRKAIQSLSKLGRWSPVSWGRWLGVRMGGYFLWGR